MRQRQEKDIIEASFFYGKTITKAYLLGRLGKAVLWQNDKDIFDKYFTIDTDGNLEQVSVGDASFLFDIALEYEELNKEELSLIYILDKLEHSTSNFKVLKIVINGFDSYLSNETRKSSIGLADKLLKKNSLNERYFVYERLLSRKLPEDIDMKRSIQWAEEKEAWYVQRLYNDILFKDTYGYDGTLMLTTPEYEKDAESIQSKLKNIGKGIVLIQNKLNPIAWRDELVQYITLCKNIVFLGIDIGGEIEKILLDVTDSEKHKKISVLGNKHYNSYPNQLINMDLKYFADINNLQESLLQYV
ncbi:hypothetical protein QUF50_03505 [Thiotrichales bacterium HSG1]|nr:hypothetical protein [Thiotrichales bacterium HSG1]